jgi:hypothetical protein
MLFGLGSALRSGLAMSVLVLLRRRLRATPTAQSELLLLATVGRAINLSAYRYLKDIRAVQGNSVLIDSFSQIAGTYIGKFYKKMNP